MSRMILKRKSRLSLRGLREEGKTGQEGQRLKSPPSLATGFQLTEGRGVARLCRRGGLVMSLRFPL